MNTLSDFLKAEIKKRNMSARQFAQFCGIASGTISAYVAGADIKPTLETLEKLSRACGVDLAVLIELAFPGTLRFTYPPEVLLLAKEIVALRKHHQAIYDVVVGIVRGKSVANNNQK